MFFAAVLLVGFARAEWSFPSGIFEIVMLVLVASVAVAGLLASFCAGDAFVENFANAASHHEVAIVLFMTAWPIHCILKPLWKRRQKKNG